MRKQPMKKTETGGFEGNSNSPVSLFEASFVPASWHA